MALKDIQKQSPRDQRRASGSSSSFSMGWELGPGKGLPAAGQVYKTESVSRVDSKAKQTALVCNAARVRSLKSQAIQQEGFMVSWGERKCVVSQPGCAYTPIAYPGKIMPLLCWTFTSGSSTK